MIYGSHCLVCEGFQLPLSLRTFSSTLTVLLDLPAHLVLISSNLACRSDLDGFIVPDSDSGSASPESSEGDAAGLPKAGSGARVSRGRRAPHRVKAGADVSSVSDMLGLEVSFSRVEIIDDDDDGDDDDDVNDDDVRARPAARRPRDFPPTTPSRGRVAGDAATRRFHPCA
eukprot:6212216-Pleurochrysis_carterae.AAC.1